jgi:hypothetical protein
MISIHERTEFNLAIDERMAMRLAVLAKSGGGTSVDHVTDLVSSEVDGLEGDAFYALRDRVLALIPEARFSFSVAQDWADAFGFCIDEAAAEHQALRCGA